MSKLIHKGTYAAFLCLLVVVLATGAFAQGKGGGRGGRGGGVVRESTVALLKQLMEQSGTKTGAP